MCIVHGPKLMSICAMFKAIRNSFRGWMMMDEHNPYHNPPIPPWTMDHEPWHINMS